MNSTIRTTAIWIAMVAVASMSAACGDGASTSMTPSGPTSVRPSIDEVLVQGRITGLNPPDRSLQIEGHTSDVHTVNVPASAVIRDGGTNLVFADLRTGDHIEVKGTRVGTIVTATEVQVEPRDAENDGY
jgi:hypothetical protein